MGTSCSIYTVYELTCHQCYIIRIVSYPVVPTLMNYIYIYLHAVY